MGLTAPEKKLWQALEAGKLCRFHLKADDEDRSLRGDILGKILRGEPIAGIAPPSRPRQVYIFGAVISGVLDMSDTQTGLTLHMRICRFTDCPNFRRAQFAFLDMKRSVFEKGANFINLEMKDNLWAVKIVSKGEFKLSDSVIGGQFSANDTSFSNPGGDAIWAQGADIKGGVFLSKASVTGRVNFNSAKIGVQFAANDASFSNHEGHAIWAQGADIQGDVYLRGAVVTGCADFNGAKIGGTFAAEKASFSNPDGYAIWAQRANIKGGVFP